MVYYRAVAKFLYLFVLLLLFIQNATAQQAVFDSLIGQLQKNKANDPSRINTLVALGMQYQHLNVDSMKIIAHTVIRLSEETNYIPGEAHGNKLLGIASYMEQNKTNALYYDSIALLRYRESNDLKGEAAVYNNMAVLFNSLGEYYTANLYYQKSIDIRKQINDVKGVADCYANLANNYMATGNYNDALPYLLRSIDIRKKINNQVGIANSYMNLGNLYFYLEQYDKAEKYYRLSLRLSYEIGNTQEVCSRFNNLGGLFYIRHQYDSAEKYFNLSLSLAQRIEDRETEMLALSNLGEVALARKQHKLAADYFNRAITICSNIGDEGALPALYYGISNTLAESGNLKEAILNCKKGLEYAIKTGSKPLAENGSKLLSGFFEKTGDHRQSLQYMRMAKSYHDSIFTETSAKRMNDLEYKYNMEQKDNEISLLETEKKLNLEQSGIQRLGIILLVLVIIIISTASISILRNRKKEHKANLLIREQSAELASQAEALQELNQVKDKIFSILAHDLRSPVTSIISLIQLLEQGMITRQEFLTFKTDMSQQMGSLNMLVDNLLNWSKNQMEGTIVTRKEYLNVNHIIDQNISLFKGIAERKKISITTRSDNQLTLLADPDQFDLVIRNLLSNSIKFTPRNGNIEITAHIESDTLIITIRDSGIGMDEETLNSLFTYNTMSRTGTQGERGTGIGLNLCKEFVENNNGKMVVKSKPGDGTTIELTFNI